MTESTKAVFLSYASQDADAAKRICDALRVADVEVWFDQSELRGGDAWDASIRKQIKECALFVPIISANTQAREEGYFRLEWKLAVDRSHLMADNKAFFVPVMLGDVSEPAALVPDAFRTRQWSRLNDAQAITAFASRVAKLVSGSGSPVNNALEAPPILEFGVSVLTKKPDDSPSIAVLAFANRSASADDEYFSDGLADELLNVLAKIKGLRVVARTSSFYFKGKSDDVATIGAKLNVATLLEGSVRKSGNRVRISVQLVQVSDSAHLWSETYDRTLDDIFAVQDEIAQAVVGELREMLLVTRPDSNAKQGVQVEVAAATAGRSSNSEAYGSYLQARFQIERNGPADIAGAIENLNAALAKDAEFALAHAALAHALTQGAIFGMLPLADTISRARASAQRALELAPDLVEANLALGSIQIWQDWNWHSANTSVTRLLAKAPGNAEALALAATLMTVLGRYDEAVGYCERAIGLDPLNSRAYFYQGMPLDALGKSAKAEASVRQAVRISPDGMAHRYFLSLLLVNQRKYDEALAVASADVNEWSRLAALAHVHSATGWRAEALIVMQELIEKYADIAPVHIAIAYASGGEIDAAFEWLDRAYTQRAAPLILLLAWSHVFKGLLPDPRWTVLLKKMQLAP